MHFEILTIFPGIFNSFLETSLIDKALKRQLITIDITNIRDFADPPHFKVDDEPYGGGPGMIMKPEPLLAAIKAAKKKNPAALVVYLSPSGRKYTQVTANRVATLSSVILVCGRYEGIDQRVIDLAIDEEWSMGDYVLMGGEVPAMLVLESSLRLVGAVIGNENSLDTESFTKKTGQPVLIEGPHYTRPPIFEGQSVPQVLLSGNHSTIDQWRKERALEKTKLNRPDLLEI